MDKSQFSLLVVGVDTSVYPISFLLTFSLLLDHLILSLCLSVSFPPSCLPSVDKMSDRITELEGNIERLMTEAGESVLLLPHPSLSIQSADVFCSLSFFLSFVMGLAEQNNIMQSQSNQNQK